MNERATLDAYGVLIEPATLKIQRVLPGPIERVWAYLTESDLRRQWLAAGEMEMKVGAPVELVWRNDQLTNPPGQRPPGISDERGNARVSRSVPAGPDLVCGVGFQPAESVLKKEQRPSRSGFLEN